jgi:SM-20-related protein
MHPDHVDKLDRIIDTLVNQGYCIVPNFFDVALTDALYRELKQRIDTQQFKEARIGKAGLLNRITDIRGDTLHWINGETMVQRQFMAIMEEYQQRLNRSLFLGLNELEAHFAHYPPGTGYQKHLDSFQNNNLRRITIVVYLNPEWDEADGGQLRIFDGDKIPQEVNPIGGTLVTFVSEKIPHQVAITQKGRFSIAGWFRVRGDSPV